MAKSSRNTSVSSFSPSGVSRKIPSVGDAKRGTQGHIGYLLRQASGAMRLGLDAGLARTGLTTPQFLILNLLDAYPGASGADLARIAQLTPQTVNLIVRKLERDQLIERTDHETHGRVMRIALTSTGQKSLERCKRIADKAEQQLLDLLDPSTEVLVRGWLVNVAQVLSRNTIAP
jgi:DNA-binding MarR family transcriptional regulator